MNILATFVWKQWPDEKPDKTMLVIRVMDDQVHRNWPGGWNPDEIIYWVYESELIATVPKNG